MPSSVFAAVRARQPLIHAITNPVTMNDVVNMILASGALAICADNPEETREITLLSDGLLLNTGMPCDEKLRAMIRAGRFRYSALQSGTGGIMKNMKGILF